MENEYKKWSRERLEKELKEYKDIVEMFENTVQGGVARMSVKNMQIYSIRQNMTH